MYGFLGKKWFFICCCVLFAFPGSLFAADNRESPLDMYLIIDGSAALEGGKNGAVQWLCEYVVDGMLQVGDTVTIWIAGSQAKQVLAESIISLEQKETVKALIRSLSTTDAAADFEGALREAGRLDAAVRERRMTYTLIVCGISAGYSSFTGSGETAGLLRYSRVQNFPGWQAVTVSPGAGPAVKSAAASFMN